MYEETSGKMISFVLFVLATIGAVILFTMEHFISQLLIASVLIIILHELGHILMVILFNGSENRRRFDFKVNITANVIEIQHDRFKSRMKNIVVASAGALFPFIFCILLYVLVDGAFVGLLLFLSVLNFAFILPVFQDGKNIVYNLKKED